MSVNKNAPRKKFLSPTLLIVGGIAIVSLWAGMNAVFEAGWLNLKSVSGGDASTKTIADKTPLIATIEQETAKLLDKPRTFLLPSEKALAAKAAIQRGDYAAANQISAEMLARSQLQNWRFYPFHLFMDNIIPREKNDAFLKNMNDWLKQDKESAIAYMIRAQYYLKAGWQMRGYDFASKTQDDRLLAFRNYLKLATEDAIKSIHVDANNPFGYFILLKIMSANGNTDAMENAFQDSIKKYPDYYALYALRLKTLMPKWGGSPEAMYAFTERYAGKAPDHSPLKLLYVELYASLLDTAQVACNSIEGEDLKQCIDTVMSKIISSTLADQVYAALNLYNKTDTHQFNLALRPILLDMIKTRGGERYAGNILQLAADRMGSQNQLVDNNAGHNNYMLDELTGKTWYRNGHYENAEKKYKEALVDIDHALFPDEEEKAMALSAIYDDLSDVYSKTSQFVNVIAYQNAASAMGGNAFNEYRFLKCHAYYRLKLYAAAVQECTGLIDNGADIQTRFWRGKSYKALGQSDAALQDFSIVAASEGRGYQSSAAIEISVIYGERNDMVNMLGALNQHSFLFDEETQSKEDLAVSYNNRCYAHMRLGRLQEALDDCTASLKYGSLPDAYQKQQELIKKLTPAVTG